MTKRQDLHIRQGETWSHTYNHDSVDLSAYTARMSIKAGFEGSNEAYLSTGSDADGGTIALDASGDVTLSMTAAQTAALAGDLSYFLFVEPGSRAEQYVDFLYDLELIDGSGNVTRALEGRVRVQREATS